MVQKWLFLPFFFLGNIGQDIVFYDILETKNTFLGYKKRKFKRVKKLTFFQKRPFFNFFLFGNLRQENVFYDILERKNAF